MCTYGGVVGGGGVGRGFGLCVATKRVLSQQNEPFSQDDVLPMGMAGA